MSLLDMFRKKGPAGGDAPAVPTPTPIPAPPLPDAIPVAVPSAAAEASATAVATPAPDPEEPGMRVWDEFGREVIIPVTQWRQELLPKALEQTQNNPDAFSAILLDAIQAGAAVEIVPAAAHLQSIDTNPERGAAIHGLVLLAAGKPAEAEDVLVTYLGQFGPSATVLAHLARAQAAQNRLDEADATLWRALEADPNDENALGLYAARSREREGDFGWQGSLERAATLPGAWLPLLWLGRSALDARNRTLAVGLYKQALERGGRPAPALLLQGVSGDLGRFGLADDVLRLVRPLYEPEVHGLAVANNLIRATVDSGQTAEALHLVRDLARLQRPEFAEHLRTWEVEIRRRDLMAEAANNPPQAQLLRVDGPVWLPPGTPGRDLYATSAPRRGRVLFLGSAATLPEQLPEEIAATLPDTAGRLSRALPLFLAEGAFALLGLETQTMVPWAEVAGFAMLHQPWPDDAAAAYARDAAAAAAVTVHLQATPEGATVTLRIIPATPEAAASDSPPLETPIDFSTAANELEIGSPTDQPGAMSTEAGAEAAIADQPAVPALDAELLSAPADESRFTLEVATVTVPMTWEDIHNASQSLWPQLAHHLVTVFGDSPEQPRPGRYTPPRGLELNIYLRLLEQLLGLNCASSSRNGPLLVSGERDTLRAAMDLAIRFPASLPVRLMLGEILLRIRGLHPEVLNEFVQPLNVLAEKHPLPDPEAAAITKAQQGAALSPMQPPPA